VPKPLSEPAPRAVRVLALCDSIAAPPGQALTGFARVIFNIFSRWPGVPIDLWSIGFDGHGYKAVAEKFPLWTLLPAGRHWNSQGQHEAFLKQLEHGNYTHVFMLMDPDALSGTPANGFSFAKQLKAICREEKITSLLYYPVDAPLLPPFDIIATVDIPVAFTEYGREETFKVFAKSTRPPPVQVLAHGVDPHFTPLTPEEREKYRSQFQVPDGRSGKLKAFLKPGDFLIVNVNKNEWRKDPLRSLEILKGLRDAGVPAKMVFRMAPTSLIGGIHLERAAEQLGLTLDEEWAHVGPVPEQHLRGLYGAADLFLTTSLGEGWGLGVTEALACGTPVAMPYHTSLREIGLKVLKTFEGSATPRPLTFLEAEPGFIMGYDTRLRPRVDLAKAVTNIKTFLQSRTATNEPRVLLTPEILEWLSWDRIAREFLNLMDIVITPPLPPSTLRVEFIVSVQQKHKTMTAQINTLQKLNIAAAFEDASGTVVAIASTPVWTSSDTNIVTVAPSADGMNCEVISVAPGKATVTVTAEGDVTPGKDTVTNSQDVNVVADEATQVVLSVGEPVAK
jgi:glycosyltransferase involved in cell wall biosynthesis